MIQTAKELKAHFDHLQLVGQNEDGNLEWMGTREDWQNVEFDLMADDWTRDRVADIKDKLATLDKHYHEQEIVELMEELQTLTNHENS